ncbi:MAG: FmdB family transcriptional regulator [Myxococcota bacterium]
MPTYVYETLPREGEEPQRFEIIQRMSDPALSEHPETGVPIQRIIMAPALAMKHSASRQRDVLSDANLKRHGFTRYERAGEGTYERTAGTAGPRRIQR